MLPLEHTAEVTLPAANLMAQNGIVVHREEGNTDSARSQPSDYPVVLVVDDNDSLRQHLKDCLSDPYRVLEAASDYLTKPFNIDILKIKIKSLLSLNRISKDTYSRQFQVATEIPEIQSIDEKMLAKLVKYIEENLVNPNLGVENLSRQMGMSRGSLYNKLLELTGKTPSEFIRSIKLEKAAALLERSDHKISEGAYMTGFASPN